MDETLPAPLDPIGALAEVLPPPSGYGPEVYDPRDAAKVCWGVAGGEGLKQACTKAGVNVNSFQYWLMRLPDLERMWRAARRLAAQALFDDALVQVRKLIDRGASMTGAEVRALDVAVKALMGMAEVANPAEFSNRQAVTPPVMVKIITTLNLTPGGAPPGGDRADVYTLAAQTMGTVIEVDPEVPPPSRVKMTGPGRPPSTISGRPITQREKSQRARARQRELEPAVITREVKDAGGI